MPKGWERYGAAKDIFSIDPILHCVQDPADAQKFFPFHLTEKKEEEIEKDLRTGRLACFIVSGPNGSGRTAMARRLVASYRDIHKPEAFAYAEYEPRDSAHVPAILKDLLTRLATKTAQVLGIPKTQGPPKALLDAVAPLLSASVGTFEVSLQGDLELYSESMQLAKKGFGCVLENVGDRDLLDSAYTVFETAQCILVCTVTEAERDRVAPSFLRTHASVNEVRLQPISPHSVYELVERRWKSGNAYPPLPFDKEALQRSFERRVHPIGRTLGILSGMFQMKLANCQEGEVWPQDDSLKFTSQQIEAFMSFLEDWRSI